MATGEDISEEELQGAVAKLLGDEYFKQLRSAEERQVYVQKLLGVERKSIDGLGQPVLEIDPVLYHAAARIEENSQGEAQYGVWKDPIFVRRMKEEGVVREVQAKGTKEISVGYEGPATGGIIRVAGTDGAVPSSGRRSRKVYA